MVVPSTSFFQQFFKTEAAGGLLLLASAGAALAAANSPWADAYHGLWTTTVTVGAAGHDLSLTLHHWINDGLMALFFLLVGLEVKRETLVGELSSPRQAALPIAGAVGGMVVPVLIYVALSGGGMAQRGWAVAMATDIAFALGVLTMVAPRAPSGLKIFLAALAIADDIGAVLVIAFFYTGEIAGQALALAGLCTAGLFVLNQLRIRALAPYLLTGIALWFFVHESGVHATIAGVVLAMAIPVRTRINAAQYSGQARELLEQFDRTETGDLLVLTSKRQQEAVFAIGRANLQVLAPLLRLEHALHGLSAFLVMPLFAFSNAGVTLSGLSVDRVTVAVFLGLALGKPLGITAASFAAVRARAAGLPQGVNWTALHGCGWLGGIGFTMSLFIATLAFEGTPFLASAKVGILSASAFAGIVGGTIVRLGLRPHSSRR